MVDEFSRGFARSLSIHWRQGICTTPRNWLRAQAEALEARRLLAAVTVTTVSDVVNGNIGSIASLIANNGGDGIGLREAMTAANNTVNSGGPDVIQFNIAGSG